MSAPPLTEYPNLKGVATQGLVEKVDAGKYKADYINWSRTMQLLRDNAPGWLPELVPSAEDGYVHAAGVGGFLLIRFRHADGNVTPAVPQAIMDNRNAAIPLERITARDVTDTHRRGVCMAAALTFGLAYELWAKMPLESGYETPPAQPQADFTRLNAAVDALGKAGDDRDFNAFLEQASQRDHKVPLSGCSQAQVDEYAGKLEKLLASVKSADGAARTAGVETPSSLGDSPVPSAESSGGAPTGTGGASVSEAAEPSPEALFKAPTGPRGSRKAAA